MLRPDSTEDEFRNELATLTLGSGAAGMVLSRADLHPDAPRYKGGVTRSATEWNTLCRGNLDRMVTDTKQLLIQGMQLAGKTFVLTGTLPTMSRDAAGALVFTTDTRHAILTHGAPASAEIVLKSAR